MIIIDFNTSWKKAFKHGLSKGLAAPFMIYGHFKAPEIKRVNLIQLPDVSVSEAIESDWRAIGLDIEEAAREYGKTSA